jgi:hypothetical protein
MQGEPGQISGAGLALAASAVTLLSTGVGALPALFARRISERAQDVLMGFSAGIMLAATCFSLLAPALRIVAGEPRPKVFSGLLIAACVLAGGAFLHLCNRYVPHEHFVKGEEGGAAAARLRRIWLFVFAVTLHNFPEGLAVGAGAGAAAVGAGLRGRRDALRHQRRDDPREPPQGVRQGGDGRADGRLRADDVPRHLAELERLLVLFFRPKMAEKHFVETFRPAASLTHRNDGRAGNGRD